jgi:hypothetical protein
MDKIVHAKSIKKINKLITRNYKKWSGQNCLHKIIKKIVDKSNHISTPS